MREFLRIALQRQGHEVLVTDSPAGAKQICDEREVDLVITDLQMPGLSGAELQSELIARGSWMPIIFISAFAEERIRRRVLQAGAIGFLSKPFDESRLLECVEQALKKRRDVSDEA